MTTDNISDMLTRIRNASMAKLNFTRVPYSKVNLAILEVLKTEHYIKSYVVQTKNKEELLPFYQQLFKNLEQRKKEKTPLIEKKEQKEIKIYLKYKGIWIKQAFFSILKRISKPGKRIFSSYKDFSMTINVLRYQQGIAIVSTSSGIMSHLKATQLKKGGEILCYIS